MPERSEGSLSLLLSFLRAIAVLSSNAIRVHRINILQQTGDVASSSILHAAFLSIIKLPLMSIEEYSSVQRNVRLYVLQGKPQSGVKKKKEKKRNVCVVGGGVWGVEVSK